MITEDIEKEIAQINELYQIIKVGRTESEAIHIHRMVVEKYRHIHIAEILEQGLTQIADAQKNQSTYVPPQWHGY